MIMSQRFFNKHFGQTIADAREEIYEALSRNDVAEAKKIEREMRLSFMRIVLASVMTLPAAFVAKVIKMVIGYK